MEKLEYNCKTPTKKVLNTFHGLLGHSQSQNNYETPPSRVSKVKNPFEHVLREHLGANFISPTLFIKKTPVKREFSWTIDELSVLKPAEIDEESSNQFQSPERDDQYDSLTQSRIDSYFSMQQILPSPMVPLETVSLIKNDEVLSTTSTSHSIVQVTSSSAQTVLTLPPVLPEEIENLLKPYFSYTEDQQEDNIGCEVQEDAVLYKRLFDSPATPMCEADSEETEENLEHFHFSSPVRKLSASPVNSSRYQRTIGTPGNYDTMNLCPLSPICIGSVNVIEEDCEVQKHTSQIMSVDGSFNVPDCANIEKHNDSQYDTSHHSSEDLSTSTMNWDLEYNQMSRLNTPRQRQVPSQRKKLSDSFGNDAQEDASDESMVVSQQSIKVDENSESGYNTFELTSQPSATKLNTKSPLWDLVDMVSSTPTKRKQCFL